MEKLYNKYQVSKSNGEPTDPNAQYFVLRIDTDPNARTALLMYAELIDDKEPEFAHQLRYWVLSLSQPQSFFDAVRDSADMTTEDKAHWLTYEQNAAGQPSYAKLQDIIQDLESRLVDAVRESEALRSELHHTSSDTPNQSGTRPDNPEKGPKMGQ